MKRSLVGFLLAALFAFCIFTLACCVLPLPQWGRADRSGVLQLPCDFRLRINEIACLRDGVNPFSVWHGDVVKKPYYPLGETEKNKADFYEPINAYTPWEYTLMLPISFLPRQVAWAVYVGLMFACLGVLAWGGFCVGRRIGCDKWGSLIFATLPLLVVAYPLWSNFCIGNFSIPILAALFLMCWCLDRGHDVWAGVCWAIAMIKPQNSVLLAVPLLMRGRIKTCVVAAMICLAASVLPSALCKTSIVDLILQAPAAGVGGFCGCATMPYFLCELAGLEIAMPVAALLGVVLCVVLTWWMRREKDWMLFAMPAVMCSISWTYTTSYSFALAWFLMMALLVAKVRRPQDRLLDVMIIAALLLLPRFYTCWHGMASAFALPHFPQAVNYSIDNAVSLAVLILTIVFCRGVSRRTTSIKAL